MSPLMSSARTGRRGSWEQFRERYAGPIELSRDPEASAGLASDRARRMGQTRPVTIYRLVAQGTIEEQILALHEEKRALISGVPEGTGAAAKLDSEALLVLLRRRSRFFCTALPKLRDLAQRAVDLDQVSQVTLDAVPNPVGFYLQIVMHQDIPQSRHPLEALAQIRDKHPLVDQRRNNFSIGGGDSSASAGQEMMTDVEDRLRGHMDGTLGGEQDQRIPIAFFWAHRLEPLHLLKDLRQVSQPREEHRGADRHR